MGLFAVGAGGASEPGHRRGADRVDRRPLRGGVSARRDAARRRVVAGQRRPPQPAAAKLPALPCLLTRRHRHKRESASSSPDLACRDFSRWPGVREPFFEQGSKSKIEFFM